MTYQEINVSHRRRMRDITAESPSIGWEEPEFLDFLLGKLPEIHYSSQSDLEMQLSELRNLFREYDPFSENKQEFLTEAKTIIERIRVVDVRWYDTSYAELERVTAYHRLCVIDGEGGIGKSYFIYKLEQALEEAEINHLCVYGKFLKNGLRAIDYDELKRAAETGFVFILDALNELNDDEQCCILEMIEELKAFPRIRVIVTYRTNAVHPQVLSKIRKIISVKHTFTGVSFESALRSLSSKAIPDLFRYDDVFFSHNALLISMLIEALKTDKIIQEQENSIASITFIFENYVKNMVGKMFRRKEIRKENTNIWWDIKAIAKWMYCNARRDIPIDILKGIVRTGDIFLPVMQESNLMIVSNESIYRYAMYCTLI